MEKIKAKTALLPGVSKPKGKSKFASSPFQDDKIPSPTPVSFLMKIPDGPRNHMIAMLGEFAGTFLFLYVHSRNPDPRLLPLTSASRFFAFSGTQVANTPQTTAGSTSTDLPQGPNPIALLYISLCFGFSLAANAWVFFRVSGGLFNPAVGDKIPQEVHIDTNLTGYLRIMSYRCPSSHPWCLGLYCPNVGSYGVGRYG